MIRHFIIFMLTTSLLTMIKISDAKSDAKQPTLLSLTYHQVPLSLVLQSVADAKQLNLYLPQPLEQPITLRLHETQWQTVFDALINTYQLDVQINENLMIITPKKELSAPSKKELELAQAILYVNYIALPSLEKMLINSKHAFLSQDGSLIVDEQNNRLILHDTPVNIEKITQFINSIDYPPAQVYICAHIVTITREKLKEFGVNWSASGSMSTIALAPINPAVNLGLQLSKWRGRFLTLELAALEAENQVEIIASPRLLTYNKKTASIKQGTEIPYEITNDKNTSFQFKQAVVGLDVTPIILPNKKILLDLTIRQNTPGAAIKRKDGGDTLTIDTQEITTHVMVESGETVVLGGVLQKNKQQHQRKVPALGDIPLLGHLFKHRANKETHRELIVFITPELTPSAVELSTSK